MDRRSEIRSAYKSLGRAGSLYDGMITDTTVLGHIINRVVWGFSEEENHFCFEQVFNGIPEYFSGKLLEVPVGTGILSMPLYKTLPEADVTCLDYSEDMMRRASVRAENMGLRNVRFVQGDVGSLPFEDGNFDTVLSLNGFHAFPDKEAAWQETCRVLKDGGVFCGCFYIKDAFARTDRLIRRLYEPKGFFTPPYETRESLERRLKTMYREVFVGNVKGIGYFRCRK